MDQEARAKGITDRGEIWNYARDKEISVHGCLRALPTLALATSIIRF